MREENSILDDILQQGGSGKINRNKPSCSSNQRKATNTTDRTLADMYLTSQGYAQAIVKISSYGKGQLKVCNHLSYISRKGELDLEDQDGRFISGLEQQENLINEWATEFGGHERSRDTVHIVLSAPDGSDSEKVREAAREFLNQEFGNNNPYLFTLHQDTSHPHVHAVVKMRSEAGKKLDPRKADLDSWRKNFAKFCRNKGIKVEASRRFERGLSSKSAQAERYQMQKRGKKPNVDNKFEERIKAEVDNLDFTKKSWEEKIRTRNQLIRRRYIEAARKAAQSGNNYKDSNQQKAIEDIAKSLDNYAKKMPIEKPRYHDIKAKIAINHGLTIEANKLTESQPKPHEEYLKIKQGLGQKQANKTAEPSLIQKQQVEKDVDN